MAALDVRAAAPHRSGLNATASPARQGIAAGDTLQINGPALHYEVRGSGPPLVLLHGFFGCGNVWEPHLERLAREYRLIIPDLRGHGRSTNPAGIFTHRQAATDLLALLDSIGVTRFSAMGISSGGITLLHAATMQPERIGALTPDASLT